MSNLATSQDNHYLSPHLPPEHAERGLCAQRFDDLLQAYAQDYEEMTAVAQFMHSRTKTLSHFAQSLHKDQDERRPDNTFGFFASRVPALFSAPQKALACLDAHYWQQLLSHTDLIDAMSGQRQAQWHTAIRQKQTPPFTREHVLETLKVLLEQQGLHFAERVDGIFKALSPEHLTNSPAAFGKRMILNAVFDSFGNVDTTKARIFDDLRVVVSAILKRSPIKVSTALSAKIIHSFYQDKQIGQWVAIDGGALRIKLFHVGTVHIEIHPDVAFKLNDILSMLYPQAIPACFRRPPTTRKKAFTTPIEHALSLETLSDLDALRRLWTRTEPEIRQLFPEHDVIYEFMKSDLSAPEETQSVLNALGGHRLAHHYWSFDYDVTTVLPELIRTGVLPDKKSHQFYPSKGSVGERVMHTLRAHLTTETPALLEPSVGHAHLVSEMPDADWVMVDVAPLHAHIVRAKGLGDVIVDDFLSWAAQCTARFDGIPMNPPFTQHQAVAHVEAAIKLLAPDGVLVAIVPDGQQFETLQAQYCLFDHTEAIPLAFDDANVAVRIITIRQRDN